MAKAHKLQSPESLARTVFFLCLIGVTVEIIVMFVLPHVGF